MSANNATEAVVRATVWTGVGREGFVFPELRKDEAEGGVPGLQAKPNFAVCLSGGGCRATTLSNGWVRTLFHEEILKEARYIVSNSGSSWYNAAFLYLPTPADDTRAKFVGAYVPPEQLTEEVAIAAAKHPGSYSYAIAHSGFKSNLVSHFFKERAQKWANWGTAGIAGFVGPFLPSPQLYAAPPHRRVAGPTQRPATRQRRLISACCFSLQIRRRAH